MKFGRKLIYGFAAAVIFVISFAASASAITIPTSTGDRIVTQKISSVSCSAMTSPAGVRCILSAVSSGTYTLEFHDVEVGPNLDAAWYQNDLITKLTAEGLMEAGDDPGDGRGDPDADGTDPIERDTGTVNSKCTSILPPSWCEGNDGGGVIEILNLVLNIMTMGMGILATIGLIIAGIQWLTARDKEDQVVKAKSRIFNIVIGVIVWGIMWLVLSWLLPGGLDLSL